LEVSALCRKDSAHHHRLKATRRRTSTESRECVCEPAKHGQHRRLPTPRKQPADLLSPPVPMTGLGRTHLRALRPQASAPWTTPTLIPRWGNAVKAARRRKWPKEFKQVLLNDLAPYHAKPSAPSSVAPDRPPEYRSQTTPAAVHPPRNPAPVRRTQP